MPNFSHKSWEKLASVDERLQRVFLEVVKTFDCTILEGKRSQERQQWLYDQGKSKTLNSKHLDGKAVDAAPYPIDWHDLERFYYFAGFVRGVAYSMGIPLRLGADWDMDGEVKDHDFKDLVHFELC